MLIPAIECELRCVAMCFRTTVHEPNDSYEYWCSSSCAGKVLQRFGKAFHAFEMRDRIFVSFALTAA